MLCSSDNLRDLPGGDVLSRSELDMITDGGKERDLVDEEDIPR